MLGTSFDLYPRVCVSFTWAGVTPQGSRLSEDPSGSTAPTGTLAPLADLASGRRPIGSLLKCSCSGQPCIGKTVGEPGLEAAIRCQPQ